MLMMMMASMAVSGPRSHFEVGRSNARNTSLASPNWGSYIQSQISETDTKDETTGM